MLHRQWTKSFPLVVLCVASCLPALAQRNTGSIVGIVTDPSGALVAKAAVTVTNVDTGVMRAGVAEDTGNYRIISLLPGHYRVTAASSGFKTEMRDGITLQVDQDVRVDFVLKTGNVAETITVTAEAALVNSESGALGTVITNRQVNDLPSFGRDVFASLPLLTPGVGSARMGGYGDNDPPQRVSVNGGRAFNQEVVLDGATNVSVNISSFGVRPILDTVQEFKVQSNAYSAENGRSTGTFNVVTKGGTNQFHGAVYDYFQNEAINANDFFNIRNELNQGNPNRRGRLRDNLYGGYLGGPIRKDKLFFFMLYERHPTSNPNNPVTDVPTDAFKSGDFSALLPGTIIYDPATTRLVNGVYVRDPFPGNIIPANRIDPVAAKAVTFFPGPNGTTPGQPAWARNEFVHNSNTFTSWSINPRVDYNISARHSMFFRLKRDNGSGENPGNWSPANPADTGQYTPQFPSLQAVLSESFIIKPTLINEFHAGIYREVQTRSFLSSNKDYARQLGLQNSNASLFPHFGFGVPGAGYGLGAGNSLQQWLQTIQYSDAMTYIRGRHSLKFGGDFRFNQVNKLSGRDSASGNFSFNGTYTSDPNNSTAPTVAMADFLLGMPSSYTIQPPDFKWGARKREASWFVQDDWKLSPTLTVNLGVRQDLQFSWHEVQNRYAAFSPTVTQPALLPSGAANPYAGLPGGMIFGVNQVDGNHLGNFAPRLGVAWSPFADHKTVLRAGGGAFIVPASTIIDYGDTGQGEESGYVPQFSATANSNITPLFYLQGGSGPSNPNLNMTPTYSAPPPAVLPTLSPALANGATVLWEPSGRKTPVTYSWSATLSRELPGGILGEASYVGTRGVHLPFLRYPNQTVAGAYVPPNPNRLLLPFPMFENIKTEFHDANSSYNAFEFKLEKRYSKGLSWTVAYTLAKSMDNSSLDETTSWGGVNFSGSGVQDIRNLRANWGPSFYDQRHKIAGDFTYELPIGPGKPLLNHGFASRVIGGWQVNTFLQAHTGTPMEFTMDTATDWSHGPFQRPNCVGNPDRSDATINHWVNAAAFAVPGAGTFGNCGRDLGHGPRFFETNMSLFKNFTFKTPLNESTTIQLRGEAYNALNHANFGLPNAAVPIRPPGTNGPGDLGSNPSFGQIFGAISHPRRMTVALKIMF